ncbi:MFS family permease [Virgibacillus natechei]|uniref:MFS family permease n=1 Tax=Virgibacillus natechei TaxID=1216297 RepID=A0ABS4ILT9_9BACI|nr:hypothetical protein [Virgibacillus natechei]MBP1970974.1 MFS family permease [Virgibacillus natechei]UZD12742.1 hypothetical protein OLD84_17905 [Virgibacillus natechei]
MRDWKQAYWLAKFEWKSSIKAFIWTFLFFTVIALFFLESFSAYLDNDYVGFDVLFIILFALAPSWLRSKEFQIQKISGELWASPSLIMLTQLPLSKNVVTKSRFIVYFAYAFPYQLLMLIALYVVNPEFQVMMSPVSHIAFAIIWLAFGVYVGFIMPVSDSGDRANTKIVTFYSIVLIIGGIGILTFFHFIFGYGFVYWTVMLSQNWPLLSSVISIVLAFLGFNYWQRYMKRNIDKLDYL